VARVLLIRPRGNPCRWQRQCTHPLGVLYLTAVLRRTGFEVRAIDGLIDSGWAERTLAEIKAWSPDVVGFSTLTVDIGCVANLARQIRQNGYAGPLVGGGSGATYASDETRRHMGLDVVVLGEGEESFIEWMQALRTGRDQRDVPGLALRDGDGYHLTAPRPLISNLDALPFPDDEILPPFLYFGRPSMDLMYRHPRWASVMTTRSCPVRCTYCAHAMGHGFRKRSIDNVMAEIQLLTEKYGIGELQIIDDLFNFDRERTKEFCERLIGADRKLVLVFPNGFRMDMLDDELIDLLARAGLDRMLAPVETTSPRLQELVNKRLNMEKVERAFRHLRQHGVLLRASVMVGFPTETSAEMKKTIRDSFRWGAHWLSLNRVVPLPGSALAKSLGDRDIDWSQFNYQRTSINLSRASNSQIRRYCLKARLALLRPDRLFAIWRTAPKASLFTLLRSMLGSTRSAECSARYS